MNGFVIRDARQEDIPVCMEINHTYETDLVWQMNIFQEPDRWNITFRTERLPRTVSVTHAPDERRLKLALPDDQCFIVAAERDTPAIIGYLTMRYDPVRRVAWVQDLVVDDAYRRQKIGTRLFNVARKWAIEKDASRIMVETLTKNYPMINFCTVNGLIFCGYNEHYLENQDIAVFFGDTL